jgi:hypothetical protein
MMLEEVGVWILQRLLISLAVGFDRQALQDSSLALAWVPLQEQSVCSGTSQSSGQQFGRQKAIRSSNE